jgi:hypothetical protein
MMHTHKTADGALVVTYESTLVSKLCLAGIALLAATALYDVTLGTRGTDRLVALIGSIGVCVVAGLVLFERSHFTFDPRTRAVRWTRRWAWSNTSGSLPFDRIRSVVAQTMGETRQYPDRRICLQPVEGGLVPLTAAYVPDAKGELIRIADDIRALLGAQSATSDETLAALVRDGRTMDAIRLLREQGLSLAEAKQRVDDLR